MHYSPTKNGYLISASSEIFNRVLHGSHKNDDKPERYFTFAGDAPLFMGALTDYTKELYGLYEKCGVLYSGLALTPGQRQRFYYSEDIDLTSKWFHKSEDVEAEFKNGWMEYELTQISSWFPDVKVNIEAYPLLPDDGFLVHYKIATDQRVIFAAGFGGVTGPMARFEYKDEPLRNFSANDCKDNTVEIGKNRASITHPGGTTMRIAASFPADFAPASAKALAEPFASTFLGSEPEGEGDSVVKISAVIEPGRVLDGFIIVTRNTDEATLDKWLSMDNPTKYIKAQILAKHASIAVNTPDELFDLTVAPTVIALDGAWHENSFHHGAFAYHAPFLGWRNWYAPTVLGWHDRVRKTIETHLSTRLAKGDISKERVWDRKTTTDPEKRWSTPYSVLENSPGKLESFLDPKYTEVYNMQECAFDMMLYYIEWTGDLDLAEKYFDDFCLMLDWEERIFDPDNDGLYQNYLNTWISDGHSYNGAGCAQSSAYNYRANAVMAKIAKKLGKPYEKFLARAEKIKAAVNEKLWLANEGVIAESLDTVGNCLIHPAPELSTIYLAIDCDIVDDFKAYTTLRYAENHIKSVTTSSGGRLSYSSNWLPKQYSNCGLFPAENAHLALMYYKLGLCEKGKEILDGIADCYFSGRNPGMAAHIQSSKGTSDLGDQDFTDVSSTYLRLVAEGLFGIRINTLDDTVIIAPGFPKEWESASLSLRDIALYYTRKGNLEIFDISCDKAEKKRVRIPMRSCEVDAVLIDGECADYEIVSGINNSFIMIETSKVGRFQIRVLHGDTATPTLCFANTVLAGNEAIFELSGADIVDVLDISEALSDVEIVNHKIYAKVGDAHGHHTLFVRARCGEYDTWLAANYEIKEREVKGEKLPEKPFEPVDISAFFNCNMMNMHDQVYVSPRPTSFSLGVKLDARHAWNWNHGGHNKVVIDDSALRNAGGVIHTPSGIPFITPAENENLACVSIWDNFPTAITVPLDTKAQEIAVLFVSSTNVMQTGVENARISVLYADGTEEQAKLVYPTSLDDWLTPALQTENEIFYFNNYNHATVKRIAVDKNKTLAGVKIEAVANEVILGVIGVSVSK